MPETRRRGFGDLIGAPAARVLVGSQVGAGLATTTLRLAAIGAEGQSFDLGRVGSHFTQDFNDLPSAAPGEASFIADTDSLALVKVSQSKNVTAPDGATIALFDADDDPIPGSEGSVSSGRLFTQTQTWVPGGVETPIRFAWANPAEGFPDQLSFTLDVTLVPL